MLALTLEVNRIAPYSCSAMESAGVVAAGKGLDNVLPTKELLEHYKKRVGGSTNIHGACFITLRGGFLAQHVGTVYFV